MAYKFCLTLSLSNPLFIPDNGSITKHTDTYKERHTEALGGGEWPACCSDLPACHCQVTGG